MKTRYFLKPGTPQWGIRVCADNGKFWWAIDNDVRAGKADPFPSPQEANEYAQWLVGPFKCVEVNKCKYRKELGHIGDKR